MRQKVMCAGSREPDGPRGEQDTLRQWMKGEVAEMEEEEVENVVPTQLAPLAQARPRGCGLAASRPGRRTSGTAERCASAPPHPPCRRAGGAAAAEEPSAAPLLEVPARPVGSTTRKEEGGRGGGGSRRRRRRSEEGRRILPHREGGDDCPNTRALLGTKEGTVPQHAQEDRLAKDVCDPKRRTEE
ncbi:unnamed protein product [Prorocentrum cordatum]|uniref:Uncharacterized protein n=1 Tax=Prorocentrum cordatum TaxID=2364126 RepID=A0ABN9Y6Z7_9DINO|nr:unnamed protein product [Polarella glacialis]